MGGIIGALTHPQDTLERGARTVAHGAEVAVDKGRTAAEYVASQALELIPDDIRLGPKLPPYPAIPASERARAALRGQGLTRPQPVIDGGSGDLHEPVSLYITGTADELKHALEAGGWKKAHDLSLASGVKTVASILNRLTRFSHVLNFNYKQSPVSDMFLDGEKSAMAFNKNNQYDMSRDHLRVFETGKRGPDGRPIWAVAATRDVAMHLHPKQFGGSHETDPAIDGERDLVMFDLLQTGRVGDWKIARGEPTPEIARHITRRYQTDGKIFDVTLARK